MADALNVLINAAGPAAAGRFEELSDANWAHAFDQGVTSAVRCVRAALPLLRAADWARIVNVTAMSVQRRSRTRELHRGEKRAAVRHEKSRPLAGTGRDSRQRGSAGSDTYRLGATGARLAGIDVNDPVAAFGVLARGHGMAVDLNQLGLPREVAAVIAFCASRTNGYMTGAHLNVDGGSDFL